MRSHNSISKRRRNKTLPVGEPSQGGRPTERLQVPMVDFAENDDNVIEISSSAFVEVNLHPFIFIFNLYLLV
jgi:hypothetical protein